MLEPRDHQLNTSPDSGGAVEDGADGRGRLLRDGPSTSDASAEWLTDGVADVLFALDPVDIGRGTNTREYRPEAALIVERVLAGGARARADLESVIYSTFVEMFGTCAGPEAEYRAIAPRVEAVFAAWEREDGASLF